LLHQTQNGRFFWTSKFDLWEFCSSLSVVLRPELGFSWLYRLTSIWIFPSQEPSKLFKVCINVPSKYQIFIVLISWRRRFYSALLWYVCNFVINEYFLYIRELDTEICINLLIPVLCFQTYAFKMQATVVFGLPPLRFVFCVIRFDFFSVDSWWIEILHNVT